MTSKDPCGGLWRNAAAKTHRSLEAISRTEGITIVLCIFIYNLREILETTGCQETLSCSLCSMGKSGLSGELRGVQLTCLG